MRSCSGFKLHHDVKYVVLRHRRQNRGFSADLVDEEADGSLTFEIGNGRVINGRELLTTTVSGSLMSILCWHWRPLSTFALLYGRSCFHRGTLAYK